MAIFNGDIETKNIVQIIEQLQNKWECQKSTKGIRWFQLPSYILDLSFLPNTFLTIVKGDLGVFLSPHPSSYLDEVVLSLPYNFEVISEKQVRIYRN